MSRNFAVLGKAAAGNPAGSRLPEPQPATHSGGYKELIQRLLPDSRVLAVIPAGPGEDSTGICEEIAAELSRLDKRVVLVSVDRLLPIDIVTLPDEKAFMPGSVRNVWLWPSPVGQHIEFFKPRAPLDAENWLDIMRRDFDFVVLDCPCAETAPLAAAVAARADSAVLAVVAGHTRKNQIMREQRVLQLGGVKLMGCVLVTE
jgi:Mrp family chromosome partitioning ATPase